MEIPRGDMPASYPSSLLAYAHLFDSWDNLVEDNEDESSLFSTFKYIPDAPPVKVPQEASSEPSKKETTTKQTKSHSRKTRIFLIITKPGQVLLDVGHRLSQITCAGIEDFIDKKFNTKICSSRVSLWVTNDDDDDRLPGFASSSTSVVRDSCRKDNVFTTISHAGKQGKVDKSAISPVSTSKSAISTASTSKFVISPASTSNTLRSAFTAKTALLGRKRVHASSANYNKLKTGSTQLRYNPRKVTFTGPCFDRDIKSLSTSRGKISAIQPSTVTPVRTKDSSRSSFPVVNNDMPTHYQAYSGGPAQPIRQRPANFRSSKDNVLARGNQDFSSRIYYQKNYTGPLYTPSSNWTPPPSQAPKSSQIAPPKYTTLTTHELNHPLVQVKGNAKQPDRFTYPFLTHPHGLATMSNTRVTNSLGSAPFQHTTQGPTMPQLFVKHPNHHIMPNTQFDRALLTTSASGSYVRSGSAPRMLPTVFAAPAGLASSIAASMISRDSETIVGSIVSDAYYQLLTADASIWAQTDDDGIEAYPKLHNVDFTGASEDETGTMTDSESFVGYEIVNDDINADARSLSTYHSTSETDSTFTDTTSVVRANTPVDSAMGDEYWS